MTEESKTPEFGTSTPKGKGCGMIVAGIIIGVIVLGLSLNEAVGYYLTHCQGKDAFECLFNKEKEPEITGVTAEGTYNYNDYSAELSLNIPLDGGTVTGKVTGTCTATVKGNYDGKDNGIISGTMGGYCDPFFVKIPARGSFNGTVQKDTKKVPLSIKGSGAGVEKEDVMTLTF